MDGTSKRCSKCKEIKSLSEFSKDRNSKDGLNGPCKFCQKTYQSKYRKTEKGKASEKRFATCHPNRIKAKWAVNHAIGAGKIQKASFFKCKYCPEQAQQYHHPSYKPERKLKVIPVCTKCHRKIHSNNDNAPAYAVKLNLFYEV